MPNYDFKNLSPHDFENLVRDLLQAEMGVTLESFASGRDRGIDLRYSRDIRKTTVIQCKHYAESGFSSLKSHLQSKELAKVQALSPSRYILATSVRLSPDNKDSLLHLFGGHIKTLHDIYGGDDLNNLLGIFPHIERSNFKLYITSSEVISKLINNEIYVRSAGAIDAIARKSRIYVQNSSFDHARDALERHQACVLAGIPGVGKTTLAEMLALLYANAGYDVFFISSDIGEADKVFNPSRPQFFYYDDFLGQTSFAEKLNKNEDDRLLKFIQRVVETPNKRFVLSTREYILAQAQLHYEKIDRGIQSIYKYVVSISEYSRLERALMLYNHLYFSRVPQEWKDSFVESKQYLQITDHPNYNPRLIEGIIDLATSQASSPDAFFRFFIDTLKNPQQLWKHPFERQLSTHAQALLLTLVGLPPKVELQDLRLAAEGMLFSLTGSKFKHGEFMDVLKTTEGSFINIERRADVQIIYFHNPSIRDFLLGYIENQAEYAISIIESSVFFEQGQLLWEYVSGARFKRGTHVINVSSYPKMRQELSLNSSILGSALKRTYKASDCALEYIPLFNGTVRVQKRYRQDEYRFSFLVGLAVAKVVSIEPEWLKTEMSFIANMWSKKEGDRGGALELLTLLSSCSVWSTEEVDVYVEIGKKWFISSLEDYGDEDYDYMVEFMDEFPDSLDHEDWVEMQGHFNSWFDGERDHLIHHEADADAVEDRSSHALKLASKFNVKIELEFSERIAERVLDLRESKRARPSQSMHRFENAPEKSVNSDEALTTLFASLKGNS